MRQVRGLMLLALAAGSTATACVRPHGPEDVRRELSHSAGVKLHREMGITVTRSGVWLARKVLKWTDAGEDVPVSLKGIRRVEVGVYEVRGLKKGLEAPRPIDPAQHFGPEWTPMVKMNDEGESVHVLTRLGKKHDTEIRAMMVVVAERDEWVLVRVSGKLDRVIEEAMQFAFDEADRPDLYDKSREERGLEPLAESPDVEEAGDEQDPEKAEATIAGP